ncbi:MAG: T9SS type A sorting domain-containing protein [candidate division KSB1 bacterium]|nr:T9SS type A sorting domain-containing protein [candidate division KSB1 bacterium]
MSLVKHFMFILILTVATFGENRVSVPTQNNAPTIWPEAEKDALPADFRNYSVLSFNRSIPPQGKVIGKTAYNYQTNGILHERIIWDAASKTIHAEWMFGDIAEANVGWKNRRMYYNFFDGTSWVHGTGVPIETKRSGYGSLAVDAANTAIAVSHFGSGVSVWADFMAGFGFFTEFLVWEEGTKKPAYNPTWPDIAVDKTGAWHVVATNYSDGSGVEEDILNNVKDNVIYFRSEDRGAKWSTPIGIVPGPYAIPLEPFDETLPKELDIEKQIQACLDGPKTENKIGIVIPNYAHDVIYFESLDGGKTWKDPKAIIGNKPIISTDSVSFPPQYDIVVRYDSLDTNVPIDTLIAAWEEEYNIQSRPLRQLDFMYINNEPHIVWAEAKTPGGMSYYPGGRGVRWRVPYYRGLNGDSVHWEAGFRIKHWSPSTGIATIEKVDELQGVYAGGGYNVLSAPQIGVDEDGTLYCVFVRASQADTVKPEDGIDQQKTSWGPLSYCKIWGSKSKDGGKTWSKPVQLTPDKDNWHRDLRFVALSPRNPRGKLHLLYQDSPVPGRAIGDAAGDDHTKVSTADIVYWECPTSLFSDERIFFGPEITIETGTYGGIVDFGDIGDAGEARKKVVIKNEGDQDLKIINAFGGEKSFSVSPASFMIAPGESREIEIVFRPLYDGEFDSFVALPNNDPNEGNAGIPVRGKGKYVPVGVAQKGNAPLLFELTQNYPNPFNPSTVIQFTLPRAAHARLAVYNLMGQEVAVLFDEQMEAGSRRLEWRPDKLPGGVYFYRLSAGEFQETRKMIFLQ